MTKVPFQALPPSREAKTDDPATWATFDEAMAAFLDPANRLDGIGYVFSADDPYAGIDFDNCLGPDGEVLNWATPYWKRFRSYGEISPSGKGIKFIVRGVLSGTGTRKAGFGSDGTGAIEIYDRTRYFTITGNSLDTNRSGIEDCRESLASLYAELKAKKPGTKKPRTKKPGASVNLDDDALLTKARGAKNGDLFAALYDRGDSTGYPSESEADAALCCLLAFWTDKDADRIERLFNGSALGQREKWSDRPDYRQRTIAGAIETTEESYQGNGQTSSYQRKPAPTSCGTDKRRFWAVNGDGLAVPLSNFVARITTQVERHEHGQVLRQYRIKATHLDGSMAEIVVDADKYESMGWVASGLGAEYSIAALRSARDQVRFAIQDISIRDGIGRETVHTATGWIDHEGRRLYLHAGGAIGADGSTDSVRMEVNAALSQYVLPDPSTDPAKIKEAIQAHFGLFDLARTDRPGSQHVVGTVVTLPFRAVLGPADFAVHFSGSTGTRKTSAARLPMQAFASRLDRGDRITASWRATPGSLQRYAYDCKDCLLVIDELTGDQAVTAATEFVQCQGNLKARDRMDKSFRIAPSLDPRGSVLSAGEADPTRQSALGRMLTVRFTPQTIDLLTLTKCQEDGARGLYAAVTAAYVRWLAEGDRLDQVRAEHKRTVEQLTETFRSWTQEQEAHPRHPGIAAELVSSYRCFLRFAVEKEAISQPMADKYDSMVTEYLIDLVKEQAEIQQESNPGHRFVGLLKAGLSSLKFHVLDAHSGNAPLPYAGACGWHEDWLYQGKDDGQILDWQIPANSKAVGFIDRTEGRIYLDPEMARVVARSMGRDQGEQFENVNRLGRELADARMILTTTEDGKVRHTIRKRIPDHGNSRYFVLPMTLVVGEAETETET